MPIIHLPDGRTIHFPDTMSSDQIQAEVTKLLGPSMSAAPQTGFLGGFLERGGETISGLKAFGQGMLSDPLATLARLSPTSPIPRTSEEIRAAKLAAAERQGREEAPFSERLGRAAEAGGEFLLPIAVKAALTPLLRGMRAGLASQTPEAVQAAERARVGAGALNTTKVPRPPSLLEQELSAGLEQTRVPERPVSAFLPPPPDIASPVASSIETTERQIAQGLRPRPPGPPLPEIPIPEGRLASQAPTLEQVLQQALEEAGAATEQPRRVSLPPPLDIPSPTASAEESLARQAIQGRGPFPTAPEVPSVAPIAAPLEAPPASLASPPLEAPVTTPRTLSGPTRVGPTVGEMRGAYGAERTADYLQSMPGLQEELGIPITRDMVQDISGGPSRVPTSVSNKSLDEQFRRLVMDERGGLTLGMLKELDPFSRESIAGGLTREGLMWGKAPLKSVLGNAGAILSAASEGSGRSTLAPIREALRLPTNLEAFGRALVSPQSAVQGGPGVATRRQLPGWLTPVTRGMGAADVTTQQVLERAGVPTQRARELLLTNPEGAHIWNPLKSTPGAAYLTDALAPFQRTGGNFLRSGGIELGNILENPLSRRSMVTLGAGAAGAASEHEDPLLQVLAMALLNTRGLAFGMGSTLGAGLHGHTPAQGLTGAMTPMPEWGFDITKSLARIPPILR